MWKLETTAKNNFVYVSLLKQQGNSDFEFISVCFFLLIAVSTLKNLSIKKKYILVCFYH